MTDPASRYAGLPILSLSRADGNEIAYLSRRFVPPPERLAEIGEYLVMLGDRIDNIAAGQFDDPELSWRLADGNRAMRPAELCEIVGRRLRITMPDGIPGGFDGR